MIISFPDRLGGSFIQSKLDSIDTVYCFPCARWILRNVVVKISVAKEYIDGKYPIKI